MASIRVKLQDLPKLRTKEGLEVTYYDGEIGQETHRVAAPMDGHLKHKVANMPVFLDGKEVDGDLKLGDGILTVMRNGYAYLGGPKGLLLNPDDELWMGGKFIDPNPKPTSHRLVVLVSSLVAVLSVSAALYWQRG